MLNSRWHGFDFCGLVNWATSFKLRCSIKLLDQHGQFLLKQVHWSTRCLSARDLLTSLEQPWFCIKDTIVATFTLWELAYNISVLQFWSKKQQFSVVLPTP